MIIELLYELIYILPVTIIGIKLASLYLFFVPDKIYPYLIGVAIAILCSVFKHIDKNKKVIIAGLLSMISLTGFFFMLKKDMLSIINEHIWGVMLIAFCVAVYIGMKFILLSDKLKVVLSLSIIGYYIYAMIYYISFHEIFISLALFEIVLVIIDLIQKYWVKLGNNKRKNHLVFIVPFVLLTCLIVYLLPSPQTPYNWNFVKNFWNKATLYTMSVTEKLFHSDEEDYAKASVGFSTEGKLFSAADNDTKKIMNLDVNRKEGAKVYLTGKVFDRFSNNEWTSTYVSNDKSRTLDTLETLASVMIFSNDRIPDYMICDYYEITFLPFTTKYVFTPPKTINFIYNEKKMNIENVGEVYYFDSPMGIDTNYQTKSYRLNVGNDGFKDFVNSHVAIDDNSWKIVCDRNGYKDDKSVNNLKCLEEYRKDIYKYYLPETEISDEMQQYIDVVTQNADSDYEKLICIEKALSTYKYNVNSDAVPSSIDSPSEFLDYFVLTSKEGFCIHYATSFVLIARSMGYPARYVQGYYATLDNHGKCDIDSSMAHAWPEVYFEGVGWLSFEPTPGYKRVSKWNTQADLQKYKDAIAVSVSEEVVEQDVPDIEVPDIEVDIPNDNHIMIKWYYIVIPICGCILFLLIFITFDIIILKKKINGKNELDKIRGISQWNLNILSIIGSPVNEGETLEEYAGRVVRYLPEEAVLFIPCYEKVSYSSREIDKTIKEKMIDDVVKSNKILLKKLKEKSSLLYILNYFRSICIRK